MISGDALLRVMAARIMNINAARCSVWLLSVLMNGAVIAADDYTVGVYYFPGWAPVDIGGRQPWQPIQKYGGREPLLGWYDQGSVSVAERQLQWMKDYGIDIVIYDWYANTDGSPFRVQAVDAYLQAANRNSVRFSLLWVNQPGNPASLESFDRMVDYWINHYFKNPQYWRINDKPVVLIFRSDRLRRDAKAIKVSAGDLLSRTNDLAIAAGLKGIYFVGSTPAGMTDVKKILPAEGYEAMTAYNYHGGPESYRRNQGWSQSYPELISGYEQQWGFYANAGDIPYFVPVTAGWDKRPLGGSTDKGHDNSSGDPSNFGKHLRSARSFIDAMPIKTGRTIIICCWNEFGEGSYIEPTKEQGFRFLEQVKSVFGGK